MDTHAFLTSLAVVLGLAAVTTVLCHLLRQPVVLGYLLAGVLVGPTMPMPALVDLGVIRTLSDLGVILLMFSLGLDFSLRRLARVGLAAGLTALLETSLMLWAGYLAARAFGWSAVEGLFVGAIFAISSTTIVTRALDERGVGGPLRELIVGVLVAEDLIAILLMAALTTVATGHGLTAASVAVAAVRLGSFIAALVVAGMLVVPRAVRAVRALGRAEITLVASVGFCFAVSQLARALGYSVALGAFVAGALIAESGAHREVERLVRPLRDVFAAVFFVSVGALIDPGAMVRHRGAVAAFTALVVVGKVVGVSTGAFLTGSGVRTSVRAGMGLAQIGEFSFILAALGLSLRATRDFVYPVAVAVAAITTLTTPWLVRASAPAARLVERAMPRRVQTFAALYASWIDQLRRRPKSPSRGARIRRLARLLVIDVSLIVFLLVSVSVTRAALTGVVRAALDLGSPAAGWVVVGATGALSLPLVTGVIRVSRRLGLALAEVVLPPARHGALDLALAPRRALVVTLQLAIVLLTGTPILAVTQPLVGGRWVPAGFALLLLVLGVALWRGAVNLEGHVQAGLEAVVATLFAQSRAEAERPSDPEALEHVRALLRGLGDPVAIAVPSGSAAVGRSLAALDLRGATVLAVHRGDREVIVPSADEVLEAGDVLALAGSSDAIEGAREALRPGSDDAAPGAGQG